MTTENKLIQQACDASVNENNESEILFPRWVETSEERYDEMLSVLPPEIMLYGGFLVGEPVNHRHCRIKGHLLPTFAAFRKIEDRFYALESDVTIPEFRFLMTATVND